MNISNNRLQITWYMSHITSDQDQLSNYRSQILPYELQVTNYRSQNTIYKSQNTNGKWHMTYENVRWHIQMYSQENRCQIQSHVQAEFQLEIR